MPIHPTAIVDPPRAIAESAEIGPYSIVGAEVEIGARTRLMAHIYLEGPTWIGEDNIFFPFSSVGVASQDLKYKGERAETRIGDRNRIREFVTIHRGTQGGGLVTTIGSDNLLMTYAHVAHDVRIGDHVILGNSVGLAGHVIIEDWADLSPYTGVHQFCRIGRHAFIGPYSVIKQDMLPFSLTSDKPEVEVFGANSIGLERRGFEKPVIEALQTAFRLLTRSQLNTSQAIERIRAELPACPEIDELLRIHPLREARRREIDALRADRRQRPLPAAGARKRAPAGPRGHRHRDPGGGLAGGRSAGGALPLDLARAAQQADRDSEAGRHHRSGHVRAGEARQNLLLHPPRLAPGEAAGRAAVRRTPTG